jgi:hypothetical protein
LYIAAPTAGTANYAAFFGAPVGIKTTPSSYDLQLGYDSAGKPTTNTWSIISDLKTKKNIRPFTEGLDVLLQINPIMYQYNGECGTPLDEEGVGVIAQDVEVLMPRSVKTAKYRKETKGEKDESIVTEEDHKNFNSHEFTYLLINAVKELAARVEKLEKK